MTVVVTVLVTVVVTAVVTAVVCMRFMFCLICDVFVCFDVFGIFVVYLFRHAVVEC